MHFDRKFSEYLKFFPDAKYEQLFDNLYVNEWTSEEVLKPVPGGYARQCAHASN